MFTQSRITHKLKHTQVTIIALLINKQIKIRICVIGISIYYYYLSSSIRIGSWYAVQFLHLFLPRQFMLKIYLYSVRDFT